MTTKPEYEAPTVTKLAPAEAVRRIASADQPHEVSEPQNALDAYRQLQMALGQLEELKKDLRTRDQQLTEERAKLRDIEINVNAFLNQLHETEKQRDHLNGDLAEMRRQRDNVESHLHGKIRELEGLQKKYDELGHMHSLLSKVCVQHQEDKRQAEEQLATYKLRDSHEETIRHMAEVVHQSHHQNIPGGWWICPRNTCNAAQQAVPELVAKLKGSGR